MLKNIKFEYVFAVLVVVILAAALFIFKENKDVVNTVVTALVGALSAITAFFFTKHVPKEEKQNTDK
ncbi:hypothetical protein CLTEP_02100 [Clostridium tepidiprofundi DSM 19306]|uniref:Uncharacterized protein n=1 Tax=Clostridium tepidiprofundi DSM 19306 TaxID=1121338 RepID=A0A151B841_9CLOT|nr:hypothetical protein [Clostridium tepidiprofundi]KYH35817.1 hypothetical protein CLTEP_02100 [Clostridium tepidiprofundi DSM 19306]